METTSFSQHSGQIEIDALLMGTKWGGAPGQGATVTFSFPGDGAYWDPESYAAGSEPYVGFVPFDEAQKAQVRIALSKWSEVANITFVEVAESQASVGDLRYAFSGLVPLKPAFGYAYFPATVAAGGDVWLDPAQSDLSTNPYLVLHESGHAIGLKHFFQTYGDWPSDSSRDGIGFSSVMSAYRTTDAIYAVPVTPMAHDIAAIQYLYGKNPVAVRPQDNDYLLRLDANPHAVSAIDSAGTDRIAVAQGDSSSAFINLNEGVWSGLILSRAGSFGNRDIALIYIPVGTKIEQAVGGQAADSLTGNALDNLLDGGAGSDAIEGGAGIDTALFHGPRSLFQVSAAQDQWMVDREGEVDTLSGVERLRFDDESVALDLSTHAGETAKILGAVFGPLAVANKDYAGIGLSLLDAGMDFATLMHFAIDARLGPSASNAEVVNLLYTNVVGTSPPEFEFRYYQGLLDSGAYTKASLGVMAAETPLNASNIDLVGLVSSGLGYTPME